MSRKTDNRAGTDAREGALSPEVTQKILHAFVEKLDATRSASLNACVRCGLCAGSCHYSLTHDEVEAIPAWKVNLVGKVFRRRFTLAGLDRLISSGFLDTGLALTEVWAILRGEP